MFYVQCYKKHYIQINYIKLLHHASTNQWIYSLHGVLLLSTLAFGPILGKRLSCEWDEGTWGHCDLDLKLLTLKIYIFVFNDIKMFVPNMNLLFHLHSWNIECIRNRQTGKGSLHPWAQRIQTLLPSALRNKNIKMYFTAVNMLRPPREQCYKWTLKNWSWA